MAEITELKKYVETLTTNFTTKADVENIIEVKSKSMLGFLQFVYLKNV